MEIRGMFTTGDLKILAALALRPVRRLYYPALLLVPLVVALLWWLRGDSSSKHFSLLLLCLGVLTSFPKRGQPGNDNRHWEPNQCPDWQKEDDVEIEPPVNRARQIRDGPHYARDDDENQLNGQEETTSGGAFVEYRFVQAVGSFSWHLNSQGFMLCQ
jgi:hypothetical protein